MDEWISGLMVQRRNRWSVEALDEEKLHGRMSGEKTAKAVHAVFEVNTLLKQGVNESGPFLDFQIFKPGHDLRR